MNLSVLKAEIVRLEAERSGNKVLVIRRITTDTGTFQCDGITYKLGASIAQLMLNAIEAGHPTVEIPTHWLHTI